MSGRGSTGTGKAATDAGTGVVDAGISGGPADGADGTVRGGGRRTRPGATTLAVGAVSALAGLVVGLAAVAPPTGADEKAPQREEVVSLLRQWDAAFVRGDVETLRELGTADAVVHGRPLHSRTTEVALERWLRGTGPEDAEGDPVVAVLDPSTSVAAQRASYGGSEQITLFRVLRTPDGLRVAHVESTVVPNW
ncbi:hypothetical protein [Aquipuribacter sp. SD81]|uniref:hypothetical protein n=1 Tax=Aquipuribacter sp. SD81 TaxID=3127703 RepID=UPI003019C1B7